jgi:hypothetical protein
MRAHKVRVVISEDRQITVKLPSDIPPGDAELIILTGDGAVHPASGRVAADAAAEFESWLCGVLREVPSAPVLADEAFDRGSIYDE